MKKFNIFSDYIYYNYDPYNAQIYVNEIYFHKTNECIDLMDYIALLESRKPFYLFFQLLKDII